MLVAALRLVHLSVASLLLATTALQAAPATSEELNGEANPSPTSSVTAVPSPSGVGMPAGTGVPQSRTVELLLQLQDNPGALTSDSGGSSRDALRRTSPSTPLGAASAPDASAEDANLRERLRAAMLESAAPRQAPSEARADATGETGGAATSVTPRTSFGGGGGRSGEPRESLLSNPVIRFIRENRVLVVMTSLAVLAAIWGTANFSMRRSR